MGDTAHVFFFAEDATLARASTGGPGDSGVCWGEQSLTRVHRSRHHGVRSVSAKGAPAPGSRIQSVRRSCVGNW